MDKVFDTVVKNACVVRPNKTSVDCLDIAIKDGKIARLAPDIQAVEAKQIFDAKNRLAFPGCVDAHMHIGIYAPLAQDAISESKAAAMGGVTSSLNYIRTGIITSTAAGPIARSWPRSTSRPMTSSGSTMDSTSRRSNPHISTRWSIWSPITASRRSRSSCSTAATGCTAPRRSRTSF